MNLRIRTGCATPDLRLSLLTLLIAMVLTAGSASGASSAPFSAGSTRLSVAFGGATAFDRNYSVFGLGFGYFVADGLETGLDAETWFGNSPHITQVSPQVRIVVNRDGALRPYVGVFYRRTSIEAHRDFDTVGGRAGVFFLGGRHSYFGAGLAVDDHLNCDRTVYASCTEVYPELTIAVMF